MPCPTITMVSLTGRESLTRETIVALNERGGMSGYPLELFYFAPDGEHQALALPDNVHVRPLRHDGMMVDWYKILAWVPNGADWIFLEDDVLPCRNAIRRIVDVELPADVGLLSFFDLRNEWPRPGIWRNKEWDGPGKRRHLYGSQAVKIPAAVVAGMKAFGVERRPFSANWDTWMGVAVDELGLRVAHYSPSLVQHVGMLSVAYPTGQKNEPNRPWTGHFPGEDFDALGPCPDPVVAATSRPAGWKEVSHPHWCGFHGCFHPEISVCPIVTS